MNAVFEVLGEGAEKKFLEGAEKEGMKGLKGHRSVSLYILRFAVVTYRLLQVCRRFVHYAVAEVQPCSHFL